MCGSLALLRNTDMQTGGSVIRERTATPDNRRAENSLSRESERETFRTKGDFWGGDFFAAGDLFVLVPVLLLMMLL